MLGSSSVGSFKEFGLVTNRLPARTIRRLPTLQCQGAHRYRSGFIAWAVQPDAAPTDQLNDVGSHGGLVWGSDAYAPTFGARTQSRPSRAPRVALTSDLATCRYSRAIRGVVSMDAAISPADRALNLVILVSP